MIAEEISAEVLLSFLEYKAVYREPIFEGWDQRGTLALAIFRAFREWNVGLESIYGKQNPSDASEIQMTVDLFNRRASFNVGLGSASLFITNPDWKEMDLIARVVRAGIEAVQISMKADIDKQLFTMALHLKPQGRSIRDITSSFIRLSSDLTTSEAVRAYGFAVYLESSSLIVDTSGLYPESLFIRLNRDFGPDASLEEMGDAVKKDEINALEILGLRVE